MSHYHGEYGGRVVREFKGGGKKWIIGATLTPEDVDSWPLGNRMALEKSGNVEWYGPPSEKESAARASGKPAQSRRGPVKQDTKKAKKTAPASAKITPAPRSRRGAK